MYCTANVLLVPMICVFVELCASLAHVAYVTLDDLGCVAAHSRTDEE